MCQNKLKVVMMQICLSILYKETQRQAIATVLDHSFAGSSVFRGAKNSARDEMTQVTKTLLAESSRTKFIL